jgi:hypothetical protein
MQERNFGVMGAGLLALGSLGPVQAQGDAGPAVEFARLRWTTVEETPLPADLAAVNALPNATGCWLVQSEARELADMVVSAQRHMVHMAFLPIDPEADARVERFMAELERAAPPPRPLTRKAVTE